MNGSPELEEGMDDVRYVAYCGLYCRLCGIMSRTPERAEALWETMSSDGWEFYGEYVMPGFTGFWEVLKKIAGYDAVCPGCRGGCGNPDCFIRKCATERGVRICPECPDYPCGHIEALARRYPNLKGDGGRLKEVGPKRWVEEQEKRRNAGFCYCDIRIPVENGSSEDGGSGN